MKLRLTLILGLLLLSRLCLRLFVLLILGGLIVEGSRRRTAHTTDSTGVFHLLIGQTLLAADLGGLRARVLLRFLLLLFALATSSGRGRARRIFVNILEIQGRLGQFGG